MTKEDSISSLLERWTKGDSIGVIIQAAYEAGRNNYVEEKKTDLDASIKQINKIIKHLQKK